MKVIVTTVFIISYIQVFTQILAEYKGQNFIINKIETYSNPRSLSKLNNDDKKESFIFYKYYNTQTWEEYLALFAKGEEPKATKNQYNEWMTTSKKLNIHLIGYLDIVHNGISYLLFQYQYNNEVNKFPGVMVFYKNNDKYFYLPNTKHPNVILREIGMKDNEELQKLLSSNKIINTFQIDQLKIRINEDILIKENYHDKLAELCLHYQLNADESHQVKSLFDKGDYASMADIMYNKIQDSNKEYYTLYKDINEKLGVVLFSISIPPKE